MKYIISENQNEFLKDGENLIKIPFFAFNYDWNLLQIFLRDKGFPKYIITGDVRLYNNDTIKNLGNLIGVEGELDLFNSDIESLGELRYCYQIDLRETTKLKTLNKLEYVEHDADFSNSNIKSLGNLKKVGRDLDMSYVKKIKSLDNLVEVGRNLLINESSVSSIGNLKFVGGDFIISETPLNKRMTEEKLRKIVKIGGEVWS